MTVTALRNLRPHPIEVPGVSTLEEALSWLSTQSNAVKSITSVDGDGHLHQQPVIHPESFVDPTAVLIGGIIVERNCYIGPDAILRLDEKAGFEPFVLGEGSNIQDCAIVHAHTPRIGRGVIVAHQAIVHGATVEDDVTIYIQAVADGKTVLGKGCFLHQGSYVGKGLELAPDRYVAPGQKVLTQDEADALPEVPEALLEVHRTVIEHNRHHVCCHRMMGQ